MAQRTTLISPVQEFFDPSKGRTLAGGTLYIGAENSDPKNDPLDRYNVYNVNDDGTEILISQPIPLNGAGQPSSSSLSGNARQIRVELPNGVTRYCVQAFSNKNTLALYQGSVAMPTADSIEYTESGDNSVESALRSRAAYFTLAQAQASDLRVGQYVRLTDYGGAIYKVTTDAVNNTDVYLQAGAQSLTYQANLHELIKASHLGITGTGDETAKLQRAADLTLSTGLWFHGEFKTINVSSVNLAAGMKLANFTYKSLPNQPNFTRAMTTGNNIWDSNDDSPELYLMNITGDGNRANQGDYQSFELEQNAMLFLQGGLANRGRLRVRAQNLTFINTVADGANVFRGVDFTCDNYSGYDNFRGTLTVTGGHSVVNVENFRSRRTDGAVVHIGLNIEIDSAGFGGTFASTITITNGNQRGGSLELSMIDGGNLTLNNYIQESGQGFSLSGKNATIRINGGEINIGAESPTLNSILNPSDVQFNDVKFRALNDVGVTETITLARVQYPAGITNGLLAFNNCDFYSNGEAADIQTAIEIDGAQTIANNNRVVVNGGSIDSGFDFGCTVVQGGVIEIGGDININAVEAIKLLGTGANPFKATLGKINYGTSVTVPLRVNAGAAGSQIVWDGYKIPDSLSPILTAGAAITNVESIGGRIITGTQNPTAVFIASFQGDVYVSETPTAGAAVEWIATTTDNAAPNTGWRASVTLSA